MVYQATDKSQQFDNWGYWKITDLMQQDGVAAVREKCARFVPGKAPQDSPKSRERGHTDGSDRDLLGALSRAYLEL